MSMMFSVSFIPNDETPRVDVFQLPASYHEHPIVKVIESMINAGDFKFGEEIENWQGYPQGEGFAGANEINGFHDAVIDVFRDANRLSAPDLDALNALKAAQRGKGRIYVSYH